MMDVSAKGISNLSHFAPLLLPPFPFQEKWWEENHSPGGRVKGVGGKGRRISWDH